MEYKLTEVLYICDKEKVEDRFYEMNKSHMDLDKTKTFIDTQPHTVFSFNSVLASKDISDKETTVVWVDSGYRYYNEPLFISLIKEDDIFTGDYIGTAKFLVEGMITRNPYKSSELRLNLSKFLKKYKEKVSKRTLLHIEETEEEVQQEEVQTEMQKLLSKCGCDIASFPVEERTEVTKEVVYQKEMTDVTEEIFDELLFPAWKSIDGLDRYIKIIGRRVEQLINKNASDYYVKNHLGSVIVNSGLMNLFGKDYLIHYRIHEKYKTYVAYQIINSKKDYLENGFTREQASKELRPIQFYEDEEKIFQPTLDDFDLNQHSLIHIIKERRERFPENLQNVEANVIATHLSISLERGLQMQMRDSSYAKATYSGKEGKIAWMMPLHINASLTEEPELVMVICKNGEFYEVKTIIPFDDGVKDRITALSLYSKLW